MEAERAQELEEVPLVSKATVPKQVMKDASPLHWSSTRVLCMEERYRAARERFEEQPLADGALALARAYEEFQYGTDEDRMHLYDKVVNAAKEGQLVKGSLDERFFKSISELFCELPGWESRRLLEDMNSVEVETDGSFFWDELEKAHGSKPSDLFIELARKMPASTRGPSVMESLLYRVVKSGDVKKSLELLRELRSLDSIPALLILMRIVEDRNNLASARLISEHLHNCSDANVRMKLATYQIKMHSRCFDLKSATEVFEWAKRYSEKGLLGRLYSTYVSALGFHRKGAEAARVFQTFQGRVEAPLVASLLNAFVYSGMHEEADDLFNNMAERYGVTPDAKMQHLVVDSLALRKDLDGVLRIEKDYSAADEGSYETYTGTTMYRHLQRAYASMGSTEEVLRMSFQAVMEAPNDGNAYRLWMRGAASLPEPRRTGAMTHVWQQAASFELPLLESGAFLDGNDEPIRSGPMASFLDKEAVEKELEKQEQELLAAGYVPQRALVDFEMFEEAHVAGAPCRHSERLALAHALLTSPPGSKDEIHIKKAHLACEDCHTALTLLSKLRNRTIVLVTGGRQHRFQGGKCSCGGHHMY